MLNYSNVLFTRALIIRRSDLLSTIVALNKETPNAWAYALIKTCIFYKLFYSLNFIYSDGVG